MTKADLVDKIHAKAGLGTKAATEQFLDAAISVLSETIANGEQVSFTGFGSFKVVERSERKGRNPRTGECSLLLIKGVLDLFTAMLISASIGSVVGVLAVPQCAIQFALLFGATMLMPYTTPTMFADFSACGGIIMLGAGLRQMGLVQVPILSMLPGLFFVMPLSALWKQIM